MVSLQSRRLASSTLTTVAAHRGGGIVPQARVSVFLVFLIAVIPCAMHGIELIAVTAAGRGVVLSHAEESVTTLEISLRDRGLTLEDPVVDIRGLSKLENLRELHF
jgi:hypothetical protein